MPVLALLDAAAAQHDAAGPADPALDEPYDPQIASAGFTLDTALGPVDLVSVERAGRGWQAALTLPEQAWIALRQARGARRRAANLLAVGYPGWLAGLETARATIDRAALAKALNTQADLALDAVHRTQVAAHAALAATARTLLALDDAHARMNAAGPQRVGVDAAQAAMDTALDAMDRATAANRTLTQARDACLAADRYALATRKAATAAAAVRGQQRGAS
jgi:hypothetical protein